MIIKEIIVEERELKVPKINTLDEGYDCDSIGDIDCSGITCKECIFHEDNILEAMNELHRRESEL